MYKHSSVIIELVALTSTNLIKNAAPITVWLIEAGYLIHILCQGQIVVCKEVWLSDETNGCFALSMAAQVQHATMVGKNCEGTIAIASNHCLKCTQLQEIMPCSKHNYISVC